MLRLEALLVTLFVSGLLVPNQAFSIGGKATVKPSFSFVSSPSQSRMHMAEDKKKGFFMSEPTAEEKEDQTRFVSSVFKKELAFDEKSGRFFETGFGEGDCIPEDEFCVTDKQSGEAIRLTLEEKERIFLDALQSYYTSGRKLLSDDEFDMLKEDLQWNGSSMVAMNQKEVKYVSAMQEYLKGTPVLSDAEFDQLKKELKEEGSKFAVDVEPKCYIDTGICKVNHEEDKFRSNLLYLPAGSILMTLWLFFGYELIEPIIRLNPIILALLGLPWVVSGAKSITEKFIFENFKVVYGPCPNCSAPTRTYFGNILGVEGFSDVAQVKCSNCKQEFSIVRSSMRASTLPKSV